MQFYIVLLLLSFDGDAKCGAINVLDQIKINHPQVFLESLRVDIIEKEIDVAGQMPNLEFNAQTISKNENNSTTLSLKHKIELGFKQSARVDVARNEYQFARQNLQNKRESLIIATVLKLYRLRQIYDLEPIYSESLTAFGEITKLLKGRRNLSPEEIVERETVELAANGYRLKINQLKSEQLSLKKYLSYLAGCKISLKNLPSELKLKEEVDKKKMNSAQIGLAKSSLALAKSRLSLERANSFPDLQLGPTYEHEKNGSITNHYFGVALTMNLPLLNINGGRRAKANKEVIYAQKAYHDFKSKMELELESWNDRYKRFSSSLRSIAGREQLEEKHHRIESLFKRGVISTSLVIEAHRQLVDFTITRFESELGAIEALWNIYKLTGAIDGIKVEGSNK